MNFLQLFHSKSRTFYLSLILLGIVSSLTNIGILMLINAALGNRTVLHLAGAGQSAIVFVLLIIISYLTTGFFQKYMAVLTNTVMFDLELSIIEKIRRSSFEGFEKMGAERVYTAISDTRVMSRLPEILVNVINATITLICSLFYLFWTSKAGCLSILVLMSVLLVVYIYRNKGIEKDLNKVRDLSDSYYISLRDLLMGFRQIRISALRNNNLFTDFISLNRTKSRDLSIKTSRKYIDNELAGVYSWYIVLGFVIFFLPYFLKADIRQTATFITTVLFMMAPVSQLVMLFPFYTTFKISVERIKRLDAQLSVDATAEIREGRPMPQFRSLRFEDVRYRYGQDEKNPFTLDVPDFEILHEEILFITGGNGSGKTTFIQILTGLCRPESGRIYIDDVLVSWEDFCAFSNNMAVVFTNHHLFKENYDRHDLGTGNHRMTDLTDMLNLRECLKVNEEKNTVDTKLSKGQQKRLALLLALLEDKPIIVLDEWAAEQDPHNRRSFYTLWLQKMRAMGKTIIAVTHDDDYYGHADRVIKFNYGSLSEVMAKKSEIV